MSRSICATSDVFALWLLGYESRKDLLLDFVNAVLTDSGFKPVICINILGFILFPDASKIHSCFMAMEKDNP
jgi:hypothetical protein